MFAILNKDRIILLKQRNNKLMKKWILTLSLLPIMGSFFICNNMTNEEVVASVGSYNRDKSTYYSSVSDSTYGNALLQTLNTLMYDTHQTYNTYADLWTYTKETDVDIDNPGNIILLYSRQSLDGTAASTSWNREHVWCKSHSGNLYNKVDNNTKGAGSDMHHLRPASTAYNSTRNNTPYGVVEKKDTTKMGDTDCYFTSSIFEPADYIKGDIARILMYLYTHYSNEISSSNTYSGALSITNIVSTSEGTTQAAWDLLMDWNELDPIDYQEMIRNNQACYYLGNFNPFIDHSEYARMIWDDEVKYQAGLSFTSSYNEIDINGSIANTASGIGNISTIKNITYSSDNDKVATVDSNGLVSGVSNGVARIKAKAIINGISKTSYSFVKVGRGYQPKNNLLANGIVYTPISSSSAKASETLGSEIVSFTSDRTDTGQYTQLTSGQNLTLTITNFPKTVKNITLSMHSNQSSGAGTIDISIGGSSYYSQSSATFKSIYGTYTQTYVPIKISNENATTKTGTIIISITCTTNSLFFEKAIVDYEEREIITATNVEISPDSINLNVGDDATLITSFTPSNTTLKEVDWNSGDSAIVSVNKFGIIYALAEGSTTIRATSKDTGNVYDEIIVNVTEVNDGEDTTSYITASVNKTYKVGETITKSDIEVKDNNNLSITNFTFNNDNYMFTYDDALSGGELTTKTFKNSITYQGLSADLEVKVYREAHIDKTPIADKLDKAKTGVTGTSYSSWSGVTSTSTAIYAGQSAGGNESIQIRTENSNSGIVTTASGGRIAKIVVTWNSKTANDRTINIYGKNSAYSSPEDLYSSESSTTGTRLGSLTKGTTTLEISDDYTYVGVRSKSGALYLTDITFYWGEKDNATNLANYIMYEDNANQCLNKFDEANQYFTNLSKVERNTFMNSSDYVITSARERLSSWATYLGKQIITNNDDYSITDKSIAVQKDSDGKIATMITIASILICSVGCSLYLFRKRKEEI